MRHKLVKKGSTIIEVLVAATLISTAILAALSLSSNTQKQTDFSRDLNQATVYNNQGIDWLRNLRTTIGWESFVNELDLDTDSNTVIYCLNSLPTDEAGFAALPPGECGETGMLPDSFLQRELIITFTGNPISRAEVTMTTYWGSKTHEISTQATLTKW